MPISLLAIRYIAFALGCLVVFGVTANTIVLLPPMSVRKNLTIIGMCLCLVGLMMLALSMACATLAQDLLAHS